MTLVLFWLHAVSILVMIGLQYIWQCEDRQMGGSRGIDVLSRYPMPIYLITTRVVARAPTLSICFRWEQNPTREHPSPCCCCRRPHHHNPTVWFFPSLPSLLFPSPTLSFPLSTLTPSHPIPSHPIPSLPIPSLPIPFMIVSYSVQPSLT